MNRVNNHIYSMTRSTGGVKDPDVQLPVDHQLHWFAIDGKSSSLLPDKSVFQITSMVRNGADGGDAVNEAHKAESSVVTSEVDKMSTSTKEHDLTTTAEHPLPLANILNKEIKHTGVQSRFRIVKIESKGQFKRGRWMCRDFADPPEAKASEVTETQSAGSTTTTEPVFYVQGAGQTVSQLIFYSEGHPVLESDALPCASKLFIDEIAGSFSVAAHGSSDRVSADSGLKSIDIANSDAGSDGTVGTALADRRHDFDRVLWPPGQEDFNTPSLLSLVVDESNESTAAR